MFSAARALFAGSAAGPTADAAIAPLRTRCDCKKKGGSSRAKRSIKASPDMLKACRHCRTWCARARPSKSAAEHPPPAPAAPPQNITKAAARRLSWRRRGKRISRMLYAETRIALKVLLAYAVAESVHRHKLNFAVSAATAAAAAAGAMLDVAGTAYALRRQARAFGI